MCACVYVIYCLHCTLRKVCQNQYPEALPKVLQSIIWSNRSDVAQVSATMYMYKVTL